MSVGACKLPKTCFTSRVDGATYKPQENQRGQGMTLEPIYTPDQVAEHFQVKKQQVMRLVATGKWPAHRVGKFTRFTQTDIDAIKAITQVELSTPANIFGRKL